MGTDLAVIIVAAAAVGLLAHRAGQPTLVAYILTGLLLGPAVLGVVTPSEITGTMAELGLAFLLFLLGTEMRLDDVRERYRSILAIALPQMALIFVVGAAVTRTLGFSTVEAVLVGSLVTFSSTAVVVKMLTDADEVESVPGQLDVGVLLVQDVVVVVLLTLLATDAPATPAGIGLTLLAILGAIAGLGLLTVAAARYLLPAVFRSIADDKDVFFLFAVAWAFLFVLVFDGLGLSIEMGAFLSGVALAQLPYSTQLHERVAPLTDIFVLTFFVSIGLQLQAADLVVYWREAVVLAAVLIPLKFLVLFALVRWQNYGLESAFLGSANMVQVSEFALVAGAVAVAEGLVDEPILGFLSLLAVITMSASVYLIGSSESLYERSRPYLRRWESDDERVSTRTRYADHAIVIGYDEVARSALPVLEEHYDDVVVIDRRTANVEALADAGYTAIYGDFRHREIRKKAGLSRAAFVLSSSAEPEVNKALLAEVDDDTTVFIEAHWADDARELYDHGAHYVALAPQLTAERLAEYLDASFEDPGVFAAAAETDLLTARSTEPAPRPLLDGDRDE